MELLLRLALLLNYQQFTPPYFQNPIATFMPIDVLP